MRAHDVRKFWGVHVRDIRKNARVIFLLGDGRASGVQDVAAPHKHVTPVRAAMHRNEWNG